MRCAEIGRMMLHSESFAPSRLIGISCGQAARLLAALSAGAAGVSAILGILDGWYIHCRPLALDWFQQRFSSNARPAESHVTSWAHMRIPP